MPQNVSHATTEQSDRTPNSKQLDFIENFQRDIVLFAGAGTGKTFSVAQKCKKAIELGYDPGEILCLTFTEKGKEEMKRDICAHLGRPFENVYTIHGYCLRFLREEAKRSGAVYAEHSVKDEEDCRELIRFAVLPEFTETIAEDKLQEKFGKGLHYFRTLPPVYAGETLIWNDGGKYFDYFGSECSPESVAAQIQHFVCPVCRQRSALTDGHCDQCGADFKNYRPALFDYDYYAFVSAVRHKLALWNISSGNRENDLQKTIDRMQSECGEEFRALMFQKDENGKLSFDQDFFDLIRKYGARLIESYLDRLEESNAYDFDSLILQTLSYFRSGITRRYRLIVIDEVQDTSEAEYLLLSFLFPGAQVVLCGDLFQSIYEWRGARPDLFLNKFCAERSPSVSVFTENYRSSPLLVKAGTEYLRAAFPQSDIIPAVPVRELDGKISCIRFDSPQLQAYGIFQRLKHLNGTTCLISRSNQATNDLYVHMQRINAALPKSERISFYTAEQELKFYKHPAIKDLIAFLSVLVNPADLLACERVAERYIAGVGKTTLHRFREETVCNLSSFLSDETYDEGDDCALLTKEATVFVVYDLETTGLSKEKDEMIQLAAIKFDAEGRELDRMNELIIPQTEISDGALATHKKSLTELLAKGTSDVCGVLRQFCRFVQGCYLIGHNSTAFDRAILRRQLRECHLPYPQIIGEGDTLLLAKRYLPRLERYKLETLCSFFSVTNEFAHDAFSDVNATMQIFLKLKERFIVPQADQRRKILLQYRKKFEKFHAEFHRLKQLLDEENTEACLSRILGFIRTKKRYREDVVAQTRLQLAETFLLRSCRQGETALFAFLEDAGRGIARAFDDEKRTAVPIVTVHQTKGCEFDNVFIFNADEKNFPATAWRNGIRIEEEKRIFYVAMTRAKRQLFFTYCPSVNYFGCRSKRSPLIDLIPQDLIEEIED